MDKQIRAMMRNPSALMRFQTTGELPRIVELESEDSPLRQLVVKIPVRYWSLFSGIRLCHELGFNSAMLFANLHQLSRYIGTNQKVTPNERLPYQFYMDRSTHTVTLAQLLKASSKHPTGETLQSIIDRLPAHLVGEMEE